MHCTKILQQCENKSITIYVNPNHLELGKASAFPMDIIAYTTDGNGH